MSISLKPRSSKVTPKFMITIITFILSDISFTFERLKQEQGSLQSDLQEISLFRSILGEGVQFSNIVVLMIAILNYQDLDGVI